MADNKEYSEYMQYFDFDIASPKAILQNMRIEILECCNGKVERVLNQNYFLKDQEMGTLWNQTSAAAMQDFETRSQPFGATRDPEFKELINQLESRKAYYILKNSEKRSDHEAVLNRDAEELLQTYRDMMNELLRDPNPDSKLLGHHDFWLNKLTREYQEQYGDSPLFNPQLLERLISNEYPKIEQEIRTKSIKDQTMEIVKSAIIIYDRAIVEVKAEEDFEAAHDDAIRLVENTLPHDYNRKLIESINVKRYLQNTKEHARTKVYSRIKETRERMLEAKSAALNKYYELIGPQVTSHIPVLEALLDSRYHKGRLEALDLFNNQFQKIWDRVKNPALTKEELSQEIDRTIQGDYMKRVAKNNELWDQYKRNLKAAEHRCNEFYRSAMALIPPGDEAQRKQVIKEVKKMFKEVAKPRIFEPSCILESRKKIDAFKHDETLDDFEVLSNSFNECSVESSASEEEAAVEAMASDRIGLHFDFLVKVVNGELILQQEVLSKCRQVTEKIGAARMVFVGHAGQRNSGKTTTANQTILQLQGQDLLKSSSSEDSAMFQQLSTFPSATEKSRLKGNGVLTLLRPVITTYGGMTAAVFVLDIAENDATEAEYTSLVDFIFLVSSTTLFTARQSDFEVSAWNQENSVVPRFFGHKTLDKICVLLQAPINDMGIASGPIDPKVASQIGDQCQLHAVKGISAFGPYFRRVTYYVIPCRGNTAELRSLMESVLTSQHLLSGFYALHQTASCETTLKERVQQINCLATLPQAQR